MVSAKFYVASLSGICFLMGLYRIHESESRGSRVWTAVMLVALENLTIKLSYYLLGEINTGLVKLTLMCSLTPSNDLDSHVKPSLDISNSSGRSKGIISRSIRSRSKFVASENTMKTSPNVLISEILALNFGWTILTSF